MSFIHVNDWHSIIQPLIDSNYQPWSSGAAHSNVRADVGWDWAHILALTQVHNVGANVPGSQSGPAFALAIVLNDQTGIEVPIGMLTVVPRFQSTVFGNARQRTFTWYLADAPGEFYAALDMPPVLAVARALLDCAIHSGLESGMDGSMLLHADPAGGPKLPEFYGAKCGMQRLNAGDPPISLWRRTHTSQYFHFDAAGADRFCRQFDDRR